MNLKNYLLVLLLISLAFACTSPQGYVLTAEVPEGWEGKPVHLMLSDVSTPYVIDSTVISDGKFEFEGRFDLPRYCNVVIFLDPENRQDRNLLVNFSLFLDTTEVVATCKYAGRKPEFTLSGGATRTEFEQFSEALYVHSRERKDMFTRYSRTYYSQEGSLEEAIRQVGELNEKDREIRRFRLQYIKEHPESAVSLYILRDMCERYSELGIDQMKEYFAGLVPALQHSEAGEDLYRLINNKQIVIGNVFPDIELTAEDGNLKKISDYVRPGHYTLIEFWASWCNPCRAEIPHLKRAYGKYHPKGFDILSISIDKVADNWQKALEEEKLPWPQLLDKQGVAFRAYETNAVPTSILVDEEGRISKLNARGGWLDMALQEIYDNQ